MDYPQKNRKTITVGLVTIIAGITIMTGWIFNIPALQSIIPGFVGMRFNAALCFFLFGNALLITQYQTIKYQNQLFFTLSLLGTLIGLITLSQDVFHFSSGLDQFFVFDKVKRSVVFPFPGRMAFNASVNVLLLGFGFLGLISSKSLFKVFSQCCFNVVTILSAIALIGYLYGVSFFRVILYETSMATHTAILFFIVSLSASLLNPSIGLTRLFTGRRVGNRMAKRLSILMILMIIIFGSLRGQTQHFQLFSSLDIGISIVVVCFLLISLLLIWNTANWLNKIDRQRSEAEAKVKLMNAELEKRVEERSAEFRKSEEKYHSLIEQASDAIYVLDFNRNFTDVNASMCKMMGYSRRELLQLNVAAIMDAEELKNDPFTGDIDNPGQTIFRERSFTRSDGSVFEAEINAKVFADDRIMVIARDITDRKKMETELRETELKFRTIAEKSMVGVYIVQDDVFVYVNPRLAGIFGCKAEDLLNDPGVVEKIFDESYLETVAENVRLRISGELESIRYEAKGKKKDGTGTWVEIYGSRVIIGGKPAIIGSMIDISQRKQAEEELKSSELKYKLLFESNPLPLWMIAKDDLSVIAVNEAAANLYGYTKKELMDMNTADFLPNSGLEQQQLDRYEQEAHDSTDFGIIRHVKKDGKIIFVNIIAHDIIFEGRPVRLSLTNDVTEKLKAEQSLQKSEANLQTILKTTDTAYALFDIDLKLLAFNQKAIRFIREQYGHIPEKGDKLTDYFARDRSPQFINFTNDVLEGNNINYEVDHPQADGTVLWYDVRLFPITSDNKEILGMMMALYDITDRKNAEQDLKNAYERIQSHINSIKDMAWKQSHLIRSPLANLKGLAAMLKDDPSDAGLFDHIKNELDRMDDIIIEMAEDVSDHEFID